MLENNESPEERMKRVAAEKREDRGWDNMVYGSSYKGEEQDQYEPLPLSAEEYQKFSLLLGKLSVQDQNPKLCDIYFELQERAVKGNRYQHHNSEELWKMEEAMFEIGSNPDLRSKSGSESKGSARGGK